MQARPTKRGEMRDEMRASRWDRGRVAACFGLAASGVEGCTTPAVPIVETDSSMFSTATNCAGVGSGCIIAENSSDLSWLGCAATVSSIV